MIIMVSSNDNKARCFRWLTICEGTIHLKMSASVYILFFFTSIIKIEEANGNCILWLLSNSFLKGLLTNFEYITFFFVPLQKKHFLWRLHLDKTSLTRNNRENKVLKVTPTEYLYIYYIYNTDWFCAPFFSIISSQSGFIEMNLL